MEPQELINLAFTVIGSLIGWVVKVIWDAVQELRQDLQELERELPDHYVRKDDFRDSMVRIEGMLHRIMDKLDGKVDKS